MIIYCCNCKKDAEAKLITGKDIYPHRPDLFDLPFWKCDCGGFVGCHHKTKDRTKPLGVIPTPEMKPLRMRIHAIIDPLWKSKKLSRKQIYSEIGKHIGREYHTAEIRSAQECLDVLSFVQQKWGK